MQIVHPDYWYPAFSADELERKLSGRDDDVLREERVVTQWDGVLVPARYILTIGQAKRSIIIARRDADLRDEVRKHFVMIRDGQINLMADDGHWYPFANRLLDASQFHAGPVYPIFRGLIIQIVTSAIIYGTCVD